MSLLILNNPILHKVPHTVITILFSHGNMVWHTFPEGFCIMSFTDVSSLIYVAAVEMKPI